MYYIYGFMIPVCFQFLKSIFSSIIVILKNQVKTNIKIHINKNAKTLHI